MARKSVSVTNNCSSTVFVLCRIGVATQLLICVAILAATLTCPGARAEVGVVLNDSLVTSMDRFTGTGHSAVYFSRICPESPVKLRLCGPGEYGSVMSNYINIGEDQSFEWNIVPLSIYLYGVEDPRNRPVFGSFKLKHLLEERYRDKYLKGLCEGEACAKSNKSEWREMVAATMVRSIYIFVVDTTEEQDKQLIAEFNAASNKNHFNGVTNNCADFTRRVINTYFPHATNPNYLNDFGMTSPKAIARSFTRYATRHPEANFHVLHFAQEPGTIKRSSEVRAGTEQLYRAKKFLIPMFLFAPQGLPVVAASYLMTGRFNPERELEEYPSPEAAEIGQEREAAKAEKDEALAEQLKSIEDRERARVVGTPGEWKEYREALHAMSEEAVHSQIVSGKKNLQKTFKHLDETGTPLIDSDGALWMEITNGGGTTRVGLSASNVLAPASDSRLAYELILARLQYVLKSPKHRRETMLDFQEDWTLAQSARAKNGLMVATGGRTAGGTPHPAWPGGSDD